MKVIGMKVDDVKTGRSLENLFEHNIVMSKRVEHIVETQGSLARRYELRRSDRIAAGEERDLVSLSHQLLGQVRNDPFSAAISSRWHTFIKRRDLRDFHSGSL